MAMNKSDTSKLEEEVILGNDARSAYESFVGSYVAQERLEIFNEFCSALSTEDNELTIIKYRQVALDAMESSILSVIETGKMAQLMLDTDN